MPRGEAEFADQEILYRRSWEQAADLFGFDDALDANGHGRCAMRDFVFLGSPDHLRKRMLEDAEEFVRHFHFAPQKGLQTLHPFEIRNDHAAGIAENVRDHENFVPVVFENEVCLRRGWTVRGLRKDAALEPVGVLSSNHSIHRRRNEDVAR